MIYNSKDELIKDLLRQFFYYLDIEEESDNGNKFHPNYLRSCRAIDSQHLHELLGQLKQLASK